MIKWKYSYIDVTGLTIKFIVLDSDLEVINIESIDGCSGYFATRETEILGMKLKQILVYSESLDKVDWFDCTEV